MPTQCAYLYGVVPVNGLRQVGTVGIDGGQVRAIPHGELAMVASPADRLCFSELAPEKALNYLAEHQRVLECVMTESTVIPLKFGTYADGVSQVVGILESGRSELTRALKNYAGTIELDLIATWADLQSVLAEIGAEPAVVSMKADITSGGEATLQQRLQLGQLVKNLLDRRRGRIAAELVVALRAKWARMVTNPTKDDAMVLNAAVLIGRGEEGQFDRTIHELNQRYEDRLNFRCVGPLPPYSFATAEVEALDAGQLDAARRVLELDESASLHEIKLAHRGLLRKHHPDKNPAPDAAERVKEISAAYELLEQYALNFKHTFHRAADGRLAIVRIRSLAELREQLLAQAA